eukprot:TRINITY_DN6448_c0_g1_i3.p3 TRINITY_DN6448_c0_g1~~TRINITY_DN6448_c0_g1_i3.p3  ORF type:complete len:125 (-),score=19.26 TRINITY_DN6448_c0_g1_i3:369-743(-)
MINTVINSVQKLSENIDSVLVQDGIEAEQGQTGGVSSPSRVVEGDTISNGMLDAFGLAGQPTSQSEGNCALPMVPGDGQSNVVSFRYYFEGRINQCLGFDYTGSGGNANNFETLEECQQACQSN